MPAEKATALVLRVVEWSETSSIVTLLTREFGKVRGLAKGARRPKGPFESSLDLLSTCQIVFLRKSSEALDLLTEAKLQRRFRPRVGDLSCLYAGYYVAELLDDLTDDYDPHPLLFDAAQEALLGLSSGETPASLHVLRFELTALELLGHMPTLAACAECGKPVDRGGRVAFGQLAGGVLCKDCRPGKPQVVSISSQALEALTQLADLTTDAWRQRSWERGALGEVRGVLNSYISHLLGHRPAMHAYLKTTG
jgi:DNA repair protein RecO (recombination protein O)